ncbi:MAG: GNAT family N-acetyltransferase [Bacteroidota bacterium]
MPLDFPRLYTPRLVLRKIEVEDLPALVQYANNKKIADHIVNIPYPYREPDAAFRISFVVQGFKQKIRYVFAIIHKERGELIGEISLHLLDQHHQHAQLAYWIGEPFWNQGIATEAARAVIQFGFEQLDRTLIYADCHPNNPASEKVMCKIGMSQQASQSQLLLYRITQEAYQKQQQSTP